MKQYIEIIECIIAEIDGYLFWHTYDSASRSVKPFYWAYNFLEFLSKKLE
jgi:hypothetical protein